MIKLRNTGASISESFDASQITSNITITIPNQSFTILGEASTQEISNKVYLDPVFADGLSTNKKVEFDLEPPAPGIIDMP